MEQNIQETKLATQWFIGALVVAVSFASLLYYFDQRLTNSPRERNLGQTLFELRIAQSSLPSGISDARLADHSGAGLQPDK